MDLIDRQAAVDALRMCYETETITMNNGDEYINYGDAVYEIEELPPAEVPRSLLSADAISKKDVLGWLLAYHTKSFDLKGRYYPHEVIGWLTADISKNLLADMRGEQDDS